MPIEQNIASRHSQLRKYRNRYSNREYPKKVAVNIVYSALADRKFLENREIFFQGQQYPSLEQAGQAAAAKREEYRQSVIHSVEDTLSEGGKIGLVDVGELRDGYKNARKRDNDAVEKVEYAYVYFGTICDCIFEWAAHGLIGSDMMQASMNTTGVAFGEQNFQSTDQIEKMFYSSVGSHVDERYNSLPPLW